MKVTKDMLHDDLKDVYHKYMIIAELLSNKNFITAYNFYLKHFKKSRDINNILIQEKEIITQKNVQIDLKIYTPNNMNESLPLFLYIHGGGYVTGTPENYENSIEQFINTRPCVIVSPKYRKAFEAPAPAAINDCYNTLLWAKKNFEMLNINDNRFIVGGHSAGGGLTVSTVLLARERKEVDIAFQLPIYPMIDSTQPYNDKLNIQSPMWSTKGNKKAWETYLNYYYNNKLDIPDYVVPMQNDNYNNLPPAISIVGSLDPFYVETIKYIEGLSLAGVATEFQIFKGCFHAFDIEQPDANISIEAQKFILDNYACYYDKYILNYQRKR